MAEEYDFAVVGAGIAGIAIAELLQRSGKKVLLLESEGKLASVSSAQQQGWFHTGALYAAFPTNQFFKSLVKNVDYLLSYYSGFPNMNLSYGRHVLRVASLQGWFNNSLTYYFYVNPAEKEISLWKKPLWYLATLVAKSRLAWFEGIDFSGNIDVQINNLMIGRPLNRAKSSRRFDLRFDHDPIVLMSHDRPFNSMLIISDLVKSFLRSGGKIKLNSRVVKVRKHELVVSEKTNQEYVYQAKHIVLTTGMHAGELISGHQGIKVVKSPLLVVVPSLSDVNFVRLSMKSSSIINHFYHEVAEGGYSVIGNAAYYDADGVIDIDSLKSEMLGKANRLFGSTVNANNTSVYFGYKTELPGKSQLRNYQYRLIESDDCILALPGKLSFAFSLAVNFCKYYGIDPPVRIPSLEGEQPYSISEPLHGLIASAIYQNIKGV